MFQKKIIIFRGNSPFFLHFSGVIPHNLCTFNKKFRNPVRISIAIRYRLPDRGLLAPIEAH